MITNGLHWQLFDVIVSFVSCLSPGYFLKSCTWHHDKLSYKKILQLELSWYNILIIITYNNFWKWRFKEFISDIYPKELTVSETTESTSVASYLDLLFTRDRSNNITTKLYEKRNAFGFHIVNFPFMSSNIPSAPAYGVCASQLVRYAQQYSYTPLAKLLARQARPGTTEDGSGNKAENYSSTSATNQHQLRQKIYQ